MNAIIKPQSYGDAASTTLRQALGAGHAQLKDAVTAYRTAAADLAASSDLLDTIRAAGAIVIAAEAITAAGKLAETTARAALAQALTDTGACSIRSATHTFSASPGRPSVIITSEADVPAHLFRQPPPSPDKARILRLLKAGESVAGCELSNGSHPILTVKAITP